MGAFWWHLAYVQEDGTFVMNDLQDGSVALSLPFATFHPDYFDVEGFMMFMVIGFGVVLIVIGFFWLSKKPSNKAD